MTIYDENLVFIKQFNEALYKIVTSIPHRTFNLVPSKAGPLTMTYKQNNQDYYIHSRYNPHAEAAKLVQKANLNADHIIVFGLGAGYLLEAIMAAKSPNCRVMLVEPEPEIIKLATNTFNWRNIFDRPDFFFCLGSDMNKLGESLDAFINVATFEKMEVIELPSEVRFLKKFFSAAREQIDNDVKSILYDFKTRLVEDSLVPLNILKNIGGVLQTRPIKPLENIFAGKPGFIVSAGPSLDRNVLMLKKIRNRGVIICVDTALKPLLKRGIEPHFVVTADPSYKNYLHLQGTESLLKYFLVSDTAISSRVYEDFKKSIYSVSLGKPLFKMIEENIGEIGEIDAWGSVISLALNLAVYLGLDPIVFLGQDFAFSDMRNHCRGTSWEDSWLEGSRDLAMLQRKEQKSIGGIKKVTELPDIYLEKTITSDRLMLYKNYLVKTFATLPGKKIINATEGGILNEIENKKLHRVMSEYVYGKDAIDFQPLFEVPVIHNAQNKKQLTTFFKAKSSFFKKYRKKLKELIPQLESAANLTIQSAAHLLVECEKVKDQLYANVKNGEILEMWSQGPIYAFLKGSNPLEGQMLNEENLPQYVAIFKEYFTSLTPLLNRIIDSFDAGIESLPDHNLK
ncbi:MAG: motility associated factor glycosyltransferase family protein [bacterium]|nr:motility associated factor glycosyltransferase family protein [bacterium]